uniref:Uncharacterized protein n=1 Tax=Anguilla anguilla TaxID=7936 RepID=A0A0E9S335_ANGAN
MSIFCAMYESWFCEERHLKVEINYLHEMCQI